MKDDGVAPVIAVMLILAVAVTFLAVFNGIYIPSLKQSAEIDHIQNVEAAFLKFSSDITYQRLPARTGSPLPSRYSWVGGMSCSIRSGREDLSFSRLKRHRSTISRCTVRPVHPLPL